MIKTPVSVGSIGTSNYHTSSCYPLLLDASFKPLNNECAKEAAKRINMHDELVKSLTEMCEMWLFVCECNGYDENHMNQYKSARELLERCK